MKVKCSSCGAANNIADDKVKGRRVKVRCKSCGTRLVVDATAEVAKTVAASEVAKTPLTQTTLPPKAAATPQKSASSLPPPARPSVLSARPPAAVPPARTGTLKPVVAPIRAAPAALPGPRPGAVAAKPSTASKSSPPRTEEESPWWVNLGESDEQNMTVAQIVNGWKAGTITDDAYVWRDGWEDWLPVLEVSELKAAIESDAKPAATGGSVRPAGLAGSPLAAKAPARTVPAGNDGADDFVEVDIDATEDKVGTEARPQAPPSTEPASLTSEQLSLQALKAEMQPAAKAATVKRGRSLDEMLGLGGAATPTPLLALGTADLATAPAPPEPKPEPKVIESIMVPAPAGGMRRSVTILLAMFAAMVIGGLAMAVIMLMNQQKTAKNTPAATPSVVVVNETPSQAASAAADRAKPDEKAKKEETAATKEAAPDADAQTQTQASGKTAEKATASPGNRSQPAAAVKKPEPKSTTSTTPAKSEPTVAVKDKPSAGVASFDKRAALAALSTVASQCTACRRLDGPKGSGKAVVTFVPSGRVTAVRVVGGAFQGTKVGSCIAGIFRRAKVPSFNGDAVTVSKSFNIPE